MEGVIALEEGPDSPIGGAGAAMADPVSNTLVPTESARIAAWFLDTD